MRDDREAAAGPVPQAANPPGPGGRRGAPRLRLIATTDLHATLLGDDGLAVGPAAAPGLARAAARARQARAGAAASLLIDNGDFLQGSPVGDFVALERGLRPGEVHPVIAAMNAAGYDAATVGNHDFDYGLAFLERALADARFAVVSANAVLAPGPTPRRDRTLLPPYAILDRAVPGPDGAPRRLRVGVIGFLPPQVAVWNEKHLAGRLVLRDIVEAAEAWVPELREAGAEVVVALAHCGIGERLHRPGMENAALPLARVAGIDAVVAGHSHLVFPAPGFAGRPGLDAARGRAEGRPLVMPGAWGSHLGIVDLPLVPAGAGWAAGAGRARTVALAPRAHAAARHRPAPAARAVTRAVRPWQGETRRHLAQPAGRSLRPLQSYFALVAPDPILALVAEAQRAFARRRLAGGPHAGLPVIAAVSPFKAAGRGGPAFYTDIPAGRLTVRDVAELYLYPNLLRALRLTGAEVADWLERAAGQFRQVAPGARDAPLIDPAFPSHNFDVLHGLTYAIDLAEPARHDAEGRLLRPDARRIRDIALDGRPLDPAAELIVVTNDYRAAGGGGFPGCGPGRAVLAAEETCRAVLAAHLAAGPPADPDLAPVWRFRPMPGTTAVFDTGPGALAHLPAPGPCPIEPAGDAPGGFRRLRIRL